MTKYTTVEVSGIITQIAKPTEVKGYTEGIIEVFLPDENSMTDKECNAWIKDNNKRMKAICKFLNENNL
jgi:hypothetical protein